MDHLNSIEKFNFLCSYVNDIVNIEKIAYLLLVFNKNIHDMLTSVEPNRLTQKLIYQLINEGILDINKVDKAYGDKLCFKNYVNSFDDSMLVHILNRIEDEKNSIPDPNLYEKIEKIKKFKTANESYDYVLQHPEDVYLVLVWQSWETFRSHLVEGYIVRGILNPLKVRSEFDGDDVKNINFLQHLELLLKEHKVNNCNTYTQHMHLKNLYDYIILKKNRIQN